MINTIICLYIIIHFCHVCTIFKTKFGRVNDINENTARQVMSIEHFKSEKHIFRKMFIRFKELNHLQRFVFHKIYSFMLDFCFEERRNSRSKSLEV